MVTIKEYVKSILYSLYNIENEIGTVEIGFDIGTDDGENVNMQSTNRIKFTVIKRRISTAIRTR